jgi:hypothetical protein
MSRAQHILAVIVGLITGVLLIESYGAMVEAARAGGRASYGRALLSEFQADPTLTAGQGNGQRPGPHPAHHRRLAAQGRRHQLPARGGRLPGEGRGPARQVRPLDR